MNYNERTKHLNLRDYDDDDIPNQRKEIMKTYDTNPTLGLALVAGDDDRNPKYVPLADAPSERGTRALVYLRQMHFVADSVAQGLMSHTRGRSKAGGWEVLDA